MAELKGLTGEDALRWVEQMLEGAAVSREGSIANGIPSGGTVDTEGPLQSRKGKER